MKVGGQVLSLTFRPETEVRVWEELKRATAPIIPSRIVDDSYVNACNVHSLLYSVQKSEGGIPLPMPTREQDYYSSLLLQNVLLVWNECELGDL